MKESPTLELVKDCSRFVTQHFEIIRTSSPHIYHSALVLTPRKSIVRELYESQAQPFVRVVCGIPALWGSNAAAATFRFPILFAAWSSCNRFIAISLWDAVRVDILDSATLQRLQSLQFPWEIPSYSGALIFSPNSRIVTSFVLIRDYYLDTGGFVVSWDLQTGGVVSAIEWKGHRDSKVVNAHLTYSTDGKTVAVLSRHNSSTTISIYDIVSGVHTHNVNHTSRTNQGAPHVYKIWTHGGSLRFATPGLMGITIWEVGFAPAATPMEVETVSVPDNNIPTPVFKPRKQTDIAWAEFHPALCRLAFLRIGTRGTLLVWDARASKFLLQHKDTKFHTLMSFSTNGRFFACTTVESEVYLWRETPTGYTLFEKLTPGTRSSQPHFSPNDESIITFSSSTIQLWRTKSLTTATSNTLAQTLQHTNEDIALEFISDRLSAVAARRGGKTVTVLDLKSGVPQVSIDSPIKVHGLKQIENTIVVIGDESAIIWNLPGRTLTPGARMNVKDSVRAISFNNMDDSAVVAASISSDFRYIALIRHGFAGYRYRFLDVYCTSTGQNLRKETWALALWFAPGGHDIWCAANNEVNVFTITRDALDHTKTVAGIECGTWGCPWGSSYKVTNEGWTLSLDGKRLLMLPPLWQSHMVDRVWNGKLLALIHGGLPELIILELEP